MSPIEKNTFKKLYGAFYTPTELASELTNRVLEQVIKTQVRRCYDASLSLKALLMSDNIEILRAIQSYISNLTILDGSVGQGEFILTSYYALCHIFNSISKRLHELNMKSSILPKKVILQNLFGMELDIATLRACHKILNENIREIDKNTVSAWLEGNIREGNFLESDFSSWKTIPKRFKGFDLIIGNPPWGSHLSKAERIRYYRKFNLSGSKRNLNSFELFIYQSTNMLKPNAGYLALYLPKNLSRSNQYVNLRKFILNNFHIKTLIFHDLFNEVTQEFISLVAHRIDMKELSNEILINEKIKIHQNVYMTNTDYIFTKISDNTLLQLLKLIKKDTMSLEEYVTIQRGEELSKKGGVMYCISCGMWVPLSSRKPNIECSQCHKILYKDHLQTNFLISPIKSSQHTIPILTGDDFDQYDIKSCHYFNDSIKFKSKKNKDIYKSPKIVLQKIKQSPCGAIDLKNAFTTQNVYNIRLKKQWQQNPSFLYYILAILNSRLMNWYYENQFNLGSRYTNAISIKNLKRLPIKPPEKNEDHIKSIEQLFLSSPMLPVVREKIEKKIINLYKCSSYESFL